jgi:hypothetical protein
MGKCCWYTFRRRDKPSHARCVTGFVTEPEHLESTERFLAPMDQTHTLTGGLTYRHQYTGLWAGTAVEYGSGTPTEREETMDARVPGHFTANISVGVDLLRSGKPRPRLSLQLDIENLTNNLYLVAQESEFAAGQYSIPRLVSVTAKVRFWLAFCLDTGGRRVLYFHRRSPARSQIAQRDSDHAAIWSRRPWRILAIRTSPSCR